MTFTCGVCNHCFTNKSLFLQHQRTEHHWLQHKCIECGKGFYAKKNLNRHMDRHKDATQHQCAICSKVFTRSDLLSKHLKNVHNQTGGAEKRQREDVEESGPAPKKMLLGDDDPKEFYDMKKTKETPMTKFNTTASTYVVSFKDIEVEGMPEILKTLKRIFSSILDDITRIAKPQDHVRLSVQCPELDFPITVPFMKKQDMNVERFLSEIERVLQSHEDFVLDQTLEIEVTHVSMPEGGKWTHRNHANLEKFLKEKKCIIQIRNQDELCCARALVTAQARLDGNAQWNNIRLGFEPQGQLAKELHQRANVAVGRCSIEDVKQFQAVMPDYQLNVVSADHFDAVVYCGPDKEKRIYLYHHNGHYDVITSMPALLNRAYFCTKCNKGYDKKEKHKCLNACQACRKIHSSIGDWMHCHDCRRYFRGPECFDLHKKMTERGHSTCTSLYKCQQCGQTISKEWHKKAHVCHETYCKTCKDFFPEGHNCYMIPVNTAADKVECNDDRDEDLMMEIETTETDDKGKTYIFFDFECTADDHLVCEQGYHPDEKGRCTYCKKSSCGSMEHKPNLCVVHKMCEACLEDDVTPDSECGHCGKNEMIFSGPTTTEDFCEWLFTRDNEGAITLCHNFQGYDSYPILQYLYKNAIKPDVILNGAKVLSLFVSDWKIKMIDSLSFLPTALSKLPDMFNIQELCKGYFPHLFNRKENQSKVLNQLPDMKYYNPNGMKPKDRETFMEWHDKNASKSFDFQKELLQYCRSDVDILRRCCLKFRDLFMGVTASEDIPGIDPFEHCCTIASACNLVFRTKFLKPETIGIIQPHGYRPEENQSIKALQWLKCVSRQTGRRIQHARNGGEKVIGKYRVDGYYETEEGERVALEFHGDFWHGNPACYSRDTVNPVNNTTMGDLYDRTLDKKRYLEDLGYTYVCIWESDFDRELRENSELLSIVNEVEWVTPLQPRDAFFGGRTEAFNLFKEASDEESINYYDVTSLYPWVNKTGKVPLGHPTILTEDFGDIDDYEGLLKCKLLPPKGLHIPVLPAKINGKLLFPLCRTCAETQQQTPCHHNNGERELTGTWVTDEVKTALEKGYKLVQIYEVWHFEKFSQYDPITRTGGIFTDYINTFLKMKQEASGWPQWCATEEDKQRYIQDYYEKEGIRLDYDNIRKNHGLRALAKLMLNSFWGKFGQRDNMPQVTYVTDPAIYFDMLTSSEQEVLDVQFVNEEMVEIRWRHKEDFIETSAKTNVVIAAYTTAQARLKLYSYLEKLGARALYADTDSVVFTTMVGEWTPPLGDYLGDLTDEVPDGRITTFVTGGPKNYAYEFEKQDSGEAIVFTECKVRGITLNYKNALQINFNTVKDLVTSNTELKETVQDDYKIYRDNKTKKLLTVKQEKDYRVVFDKRVIQQNYETVPYGF